MHEYPIAIRTTTEADWPRVRRLRIENATDNPISYGATLETTLAMTEDDWRLRARRGEADDATSLVAWDTVTGRWVGMMSAQLGDEDGPEPVLTGVYVTPDHRGRQHGVADALLDGIVGWAFGRGARLRLYVYEHAVPARKFYDRNGFALTGRTRPLTFTAGQTLEMARVLPAR
ncbi:GNAT family N-acetyltransferase [Curtobacterium sp. 'Ferrero']|uniref:GNAT family N-acetyltransferase n=1 Tax=Curtobacterium sp. 'Ferrero' TaxID=2033654 RepID=UPI000BDBED17|nr:GNAT family N-acetyltransferase [Curtobacterium sp. 'Ferrero']PCN48120.1 GNAT family N-acetyltransferase [Curtobacterium sp. 'Ferrero']